MTVQFFRNGNNNAKLATEGINHLVQLCFVSSFFYCQICYVDCKLVPASVCIQLQFIAQTSIAVCYCMYIQQLLLTTQTSITVCYCMYIAAVYSIYVCLFQSSFYIYDIDQNKWVRITEDTFSMGGPRLIFDHQMCIDIESQTIFVFGGKIQW